MKISHLHRGIVAKEPPKGPDYPVISIIKTIEQWSDLERLHSLFSFAKSLGIHHVQHLLRTARLTLVQSIALGLALPILRDNPPHFDYLVEYVSHRTDYPIKLRLALAIRLVKCAISNHKADALVETGLLQSLHHDHPGFQYPLYMLSAHSSAPIPPVPIVTGDYMLDTMSFYYAGWLQMFTGDFPAADWTFRCAWILSRAAKHVRRSIVFGMSLSAFLTHKSRRLFEARFPQKYFPRSGIAREIWNLDDLPFGEWPGPYQRFQVEIGKEFARRVLVDLSQSVRVISLHEACVLCKFCKEEHVQEVLCGSEELRGAVEDDKVFLEAPVLNVAVEEEINALAAEMGRAG
jgi:hypothetical protein